MGLRDIRTRSFGVKGRRLFRSDGGESNPIKADAATPSRRSTVGLSLIPARTPVDGALERQRYRGVRAIHD